MSAPDPRLERIERLLHEGNELRRQAIALQQQALAQQQSLMDEQRANLARASEVNDQALLLQRRARRVVTVIIPILFVLIGYVSWLMFFERYR